MPFAVNKGVRLHWQERGTGTPVVLVMGHRYSSAMWYPVLDALANDEHREELARILGHGPPDGEMLDRALEIIRTGGSVDRARQAVTAEVERATGLARRLPEGPVQHALVQLAKFLAARCGAEQGA